MGLKCPSWVIFNDAVSRPLCTQLMSKASLMSFCFQRCLNSYIWCKQWRCVQGLRMPSQGQCPPWAFWGPWGLSLQVTLTGSSPAGEGMLKTCFLSLNSFCFKTYLAKEIKVHSLERAGWCNPACPVNIPLLLRMLTKLVTVTFPMDAKERFSRCQSQNKRSTDNRYTRRHSNVSVNHF